LKFILYMILFKIFTPALRVPTRRHSFTGLLFRVLPRQSTLVFAQMALTLNDLLNQLVELKARVKQLEELLDEWCDEGQHCDDWGCPLKHDPSTVQCAAGQYCLKGVVCRLKHDPSTVQCTRGINCDLRWCKLLHPKVDCPDGTTCTKNWCKRYHNDPLFSAVEPE